MWIVWKKRVEGETKKGVHTAHSLHDCGLVAKISNAKLIYYFE